MGAITTTGEGPLNLNWWARLLGLLGWTRLGRVAKSDRLIRQARALESAEPRRAMAVYTRAIDLLCTTEWPEPEKRALLGPALLSRGQLQEAAGETSPALKSYLQAKPILSALPQPALIFVAATLARQGVTNAEAMAIYLELVGALKNQRSAHTAAQPVYALLEKHGAVEETGSQQTSNRLALCRRVIETDPNLEWAHYYVGVAHFTQREYDDALPCFERAASLQSQRNLLDFYRAFSRGMCNLRAGELEPAIAALRQAVLAAPQRDDAQFVLGKSLLELGQSASLQALDRAPRIAEATTYLEGAAQLSPRQSEYADCLGQAYALADHHARAVEAFERAIRLDSKQSGYYLHLACSLKVLGSAEAAKIAARSAIDLDRQCAPAHRLLGEIYLEAEDYQSAAPELQTFLAFNPNDDEAREKLGFAFYSLGQYAEAIRTMEKIRTQTSTAAFYLARCCAQSNQTQKAVEHLQELAAHPPVDPQVFYYLALGYAHLNRFNEAVAAFGSAIQANCAEARTYFQRGHAYVRLKRLAEARADYEKARELQPDNDEILLHLGNLCHIMADDQAAVAHFLQMLRLVPGHVAARLALGVLYEKEQRMQEALAIYSAAAALEPDNPAIHRRLGVLQCRQGDYETASQSLEQAAALGDESDEIHYYRGLTAAHRRDLTATLAAWKILQERHPEDRRLALNLNRLHYQLGKGHVEARRWREAAAEWVAYLESRPDDEELKKEIAKLHLRKALDEMSNDEISEARATLEQARAYDPDCELYRYYSVLCDLAQGQWDGYTTAVQGLLPRLHPHFQRHARYHLAIAWLAKDEPEKARLLLTEVIAEEGAPAFGVNLPLAIVHAKAGQWVEAAKLLSAMMGTVV